MTAPASAVVQAAGGAVWRRAPGGAGLQVLLVHRPRYDDWTLPKGKLDAGETHADAALREVREETGLHCTLGPELASTSYRDRRDRPKTVRYWAMTPVAGAFVTPVAGEFVPTDEVDELRWLGVEEASAMLTYGRDRAVLTALVVAVAV